MLALGLSSKREITRTRIRVRTAMAAQTREQGRYLGGRPPYGYRLGDAGPHPNKAHAAWGRRAHRLEPDPVTAPVVQWMFAQRLAGHSAARITRALNDAGVPCPSASDPGRNPHRTARRGRCGPSPRSWPTPGTRAGRCGTGSGPTSTWPTRPTPASGTGRCSGGTCPKAGSSPSIRRMRRWSARPTSSPPRTRPRRAARRPGGAPVPARRAAGLRPVRAAAGIGLVQRQARLPVPPRPHQRHQPGPRQAEEHLRPRGPGPAAPSRDRHPARRPGRETGPREPQSLQVTGPADTAALIDQLRADGVVLTYDPDDRTLRAGACAVRHHRQDATDIRAPEQGKEDRLEKARKRAPAAAGG